MNRQFEEHPQAGFTLIATLIGITVMAAMALVAVTAVRGDIPLYSRDISNKRAYEAAKAGVEDYAFHLYSDPLYWTQCTGVPTPNAVNQQGSTTKRRKVPGDGTAEYAIELIPATGQSECETSNPTESMIETSGQMTGSFRIRSTGFVENQKASIVTTFKRPSFLDYVYFTQRETSDPVTYGFPEGSPELKQANEQCGLTYEKGRNSKPFAIRTYEIENSFHRMEKKESKEECTVISFKTGDNIKGPLHTNDTIAICGNPTFGRETSDVIEMSAKAPGWYDSCGGSKPKFLGTPIAPASVLVPPESNSKLKAIAEEAGYVYPGQIYMCLNGTNIETSTTSPNCGSGSTVKSIPSNGVVYIKSGTCSSGYSPFTATYPTSSECGTVYVHGTYTGQLTIAAENDIIINGNICRSSCTSPSGGGVLGLIANNFVRVYHPYEATYTKNELAEGLSENCGTKTGETTLSNLYIDAAILAINHSFIVDHYNCGSHSMGNLTVEGAIAQKFRGAVATQAGTGYTKNYVYDDRLRYLEPPSFIEPTGTSWVIGRETEG